MGLEDVKQWCIFASWARFGVKNYTLYYLDYIKLYVTTIMSIVNTENPDRVYLTSSPSDGKETVREGYVAKDPGSELYGDSKFLSPSPGYNNWLTGHKTPSYLLTLISCICVCLFTDLLSRFSVVHPRGFHVFHSCSSVSVCVCGWVHVCVSSCMHTCVCG